MQDGLTYICNACGEEIVVPIDLSAGTSQEYTEDCPVCCRPNVIHVVVDEAGDVRVWAEREEAPIREMTMKQKPRSAVPRKASGSREIRRVEDIPNIGT